MSLYITVHFDLGFSKRPWVIEHRPIDKNQAQGDAVKEKKTTAIAARRSPPIAARPSPSIAALYRLGYIVKEKTTAMDKSRLEAGLCRRICFSSTVYVAGVQNVADRLEAGLV
ncbi:hypothetical protein L2E82_16309 [Cichorium intybus]|uniref:Uncharacterized protein n=1 Tax=Cichorium intybus TaxID=13427 RepID=A0ACB9F6D6_CICIN|nr:hypothetical protein L2E82_16309 [Cichorium intybus]